jgi:hypothetical protein
MVRLTTQLLYNTIGFLGVPQSQFGRGGKEKNPCSCRESNPGHPVSKTDTVLLVPIQNFHQKQVKMMAKRHLELQRTHLKNITILYLFSLSC